MMGDAYRVAKQAYDKKDKTMTTRDAGLTQEPVEAAEVHALVHLIAARSRARAHLAAIRHSCPAVWSVACGVAELKNKIHNSESLKAPRIFCVSNTRHTRYTGRADRAAYIT
jgi:uncharacterized RmlC-like cupin family protein